MGEKKPKVGIIDTILHEERITADKQKVTYTANLDVLPNGVMVTLDDPSQAYLVQADWLWLWTPFGYGEKRERESGRSVQVLMPYSTVQAVKMGFEVGVGV